MEYERTEDAQIQADFAGRAGQVLLQYERLKPQLPLNEQYEATLAIALLQTMLTQCQELLKKYRSRGKAPQGLQELVAMAKRGFHEPPPMLGLTQDCILERWPSENPVKYRDLIECIRNALSHPLLQNSESLPRTGYTTQKGASGLIEAFVFTQSPWVGPSGALKPEFHAVKAVNDWAKRAGVANVALIETEEGYRPGRDGIPFLPVMRVRLDVAQLRLFVLGLSDYLSEPLRLQIGQEAKRVLV